MLMHVPLQIPLSITNKLRLKIHKLLAKNKPKINYNTFLQSVVYFVYFHLNNNNITYITVFMNFNEL